VHHFDAYGLKNIRGISRGGAIFERNRIDQPLVLVDQVFPGVLVAQDATLDETFVFADLDAIITEALVDVRLIERSVAG
jgi:hypothetical protein